MTKNYYLILGISADASREDIKAAFRRRALELHPDRSGLESGPFQDVQEAYSVLGDPERRRRYDREHPASVGRASRSGPAPEPMVSKRPRGEPFNPAGDSPEFREVSLAESFETYRPSFEELFERFWRNFADVNRPKSEKLESLTVEVLVGPEEAAEGGMARIWVPTRMTCRACRGQGSVGSYECWQCEGHGVLISETPVELEYPPGIQDGYATRISLARYGISNFYLTVLFRVGTAD